MDETLSVLEREVKPTAAMLFHKFKQFASTMYFHPFPLSSWLPAVIPEAERDAEERFRSQGKRGEVGIRESDGGESGSGSSNRRE